MCRAFFARCLFAAAALLPLVVVHVAAAQAAAQAATPDAGAEAVPAQRTVAPPERFDFDRTPGRLPKDAVPTRYRLALTLDPERDDFEGQVLIELRVRRAMPALLLHADTLQATGGATMTGPDGRRRALRIEADDAASLWRLVPVDGEPIEPGRHAVQLAYRGRVRTAGEGLYRVSDSQPGAAQRMLFTQLQAVNARSVFPCFDEPAFRAVFELDVRAPRGLTVVANMPRRSLRADGALELHRFAPTPPMPTYLVALAVGRFDTLEGRAGRVPLRILTAPGKREQARYAMDATRRLVPYFERYFGMPYALPKLDQLAVPGVRQGAMEDWGLISYNEALLLVDPQHSGPEVRQWVFSLAAHEISHQWFGNLVTASSWDEIWLNEAFATWMEGKATDHFNPDWQMPLHERRSIDRAMARDASAATRAIRSGMVDEKQVSGQFDNITYGKGGSVLSMLEQWLGPEVFQRGLAAYMRERRHSNAGAGDLWHHMGRASGRDVAALAGSWTDQPGLPLVELETACRDGRTLVTLRQRRFALVDKLPPQRWQVPVLLMRGEQRATLLLSGDAAQHAFSGCGDEPVLANAGGRGYYRVAYPAAQRSRLAERFGALAPADRMTLLSDSFALAQAGQQPLSDYLGLLARLPLAEGAGRGALFAQAADALVFLDETLAGLPAQALLRTRARAVLGPELARLGWSAPAAEPVEESRLRARLIGLLARFDDAAVIEQARGLFDADAAGRQPLSPALRPGVVGAVGMHATAAQFDRLKAQLLAARSEEDRWLLSEALAGTRDRGQAEALLALSLSGGLPPNIAAELPGLVARAASFGALAYEFTRSNWSALAKLAGDGPFGGSLWLLPNAASSFHGADDVAALLRDQQQAAGPAGAATAARVAARIALRAAVRQREAAGVTVAGP
jgi:aminopeptidase N